MHPSDRYPLVDALLIVGSPLLLAVVETVHPRPHDLMNINVRIWLTVHYAQIALFPLAALAVVRLVRGLTDFAAVVCRVAMFIFAASWTAWDAVAGLATGILVEAAQKSQSPSAWRDAVDAIWSHPIMGGSSSRASVLGVLGAVALSVGAIAAAVTMKRNGDSWAPVVLLGASTLGITIFRTHAWPGGPLTFLGLAVAGAWLLSDRARRSKMRSINPNGTS